MRDTRNNENTKLQRKQIPSWHERTNPPKNMECDTEVNPNRCHLLLRNRLQQKCTIVIFVQDGQQTQYHRDNYLRIRSEIQLQLHGVPDLWQNATKRIRSQCRRQGNMPIRIVFSMGVNLFYMDILCTHMIYCGIEHSRSPCKRCFKCLNTSNI